MIKQIWLINPRSGGHRGLEVLKTLTGRVHAIALDFSNLSEQFAETTKTAEQLPPN